MEVNSNMAPAAIDPTFCRVCVRLCNGIDRDEYFVYLPLLLAMSNSNTVSSHIRNESLYLCPSNRTNDMTITLIF